MIRRLRDAGAVIIGKTTVPEMMVWSFTETLTFGSTRNPATPATHQAVAAAAVVLRWGGIGIDGAGFGRTGSIRIPSTWCGLFGISHNATAFR